MAHRGFSREGLENSMAAFRAAVELGCRYVETDVHTTSDGVLLLFHDDTLDRVTDGRGRISELTAADVAAARIGGFEPVPLFDELLTAFPEVRVNLDVKDWGSVHTLAAGIERHGAHDRVLVASFSDRRRRAVLKLLSRPVASSAGVVTNGLFVLLGPFFRSLCCALCSGARCVTFRRCRCRCGRGRSVWSRPVLSAARTPSASRSTSGPSMIPPRCAACWTLAWTGS